MGIKVKDCYVIKPAEPTWNGIQPLSEFDQIAPLAHIPNIYFYNSESIKDWMNPPNKIITTLKNSLSRALVPFYPLAGRLHVVEDNQLELHCNGAGVELFEAESTQVISDFGDFSNFKNFEQLFPLVDSSKPLRDQPLCLMQLTWFQCGGIALAITISHVGADGLSATHFIGEWARLARGETLESLPFLNRPIPPAKKMSVNESTDGLGYKDFFPQLPKLIHGGDKYGEEKESVAKMLTLRKTQVDTLKLVANRGAQHVYGKRPYGRFEAITSHIWRSACKARGLASEQMTALGFCVDIRRRMDPPLPSRYFGNGIVDVAASCQVGELMSMPLSYACQKIREENEKVNGDYVRSMINFLETRRRLPKTCQEQGVKGNNEKGVTTGNPNLVVSSWLSLPVRGKDFGWGNEMYMGPATHDFDGDVMILPGYTDDGSVVVVVGLQATHMEKFKRFFYEDIEILAQLL